MSPSFGSGRILPLQAHRQQVVDRRDQRQDHPVRMGKSHGQEQSPDGQQGSDVLWMGNEREREALDPGHFMPQLVAVEDSDLAQAPEHAEIENLSADDKRDAQSQPDRRSGWSWWKGLGECDDPDGEDAELDGLEQQEQPFQRIDRILVSDPPAEAVRIAPDEDIGHPLDSQKASGQQRRKQHSEHRLWQDRAQCMKPISQFYGKAKK